MRWFFRSFLQLAVILCSLFFVLPSVGLTDTISLNTSTQFLWGDDLTGSSQSIFAQYLRVSIAPENKKYSFTGYGRIWKDMGDGIIMDNDLSSRIYYFYMDYSALENLSFRLGRQYVNYTAGSSILDGLSLDISDLGPVGITLSGGMDVNYSLDSEHSRLGNYFVGIDVHLEKIRSTQMGISYVRRYDEWDRAREEFGLNFRYFYRFLSPYVEVRYDRLSETVDQGVAGVELFPYNNIMIKGEFYHSYPTFDSTSIYSVFAVDKYQEYLVSAEYSFESPVTLSVSYVRQRYEDSENADLFRVGSRFVPSSNVNISASVDYRKGYGGSLWGVELFGDYRMRERLTIFAGAQYDSYRRPDFTDSDYDNAHRLWVGGLWRFNDHVNLSARIEDNMNENFDHRPLGRLALNWNM